MSNDTSKPARRTRDITAQWPGAYLADFDPAELGVLAGDQDPIDELHVAELADSMRVVGQLEPIHVRRLDDGTFEILAGRHRREACRTLGAKVHAIVHTQCGEDLADKICVIENDRRRHASAYHTALRLNQLRNRGGHCSAEEVAAEVGMKPARVRQYLAVFNGSDKLLDAFRKHHFTIELATELVRYERQMGIPATRKYVAKAIAGELTVRELRSRRETPRVVRRPEGAPTSAWSRALQRVRALATKDTAAAAERLRELEAVAAAVRAQVAPASPTEAVDG